MRSYVVAALLAASFAFACGGGSGDASGNGDDAADTLVASDVGGDSSSDSSPPSHDADGSSDADDSHHDTRPATDGPTSDAPNTDLVSMPLGDSITGEPHTYREALYGSLTGAGCKVHFVGSQNDVYATIPEKNHEGHPGFTIGGIDTNIDAWIAAHPPKYVLLMIGTNDIAWWYSDTIANTADAHAKLVDKVLADAPDAWVVVASIPPESSKLVDPTKVDRADLANQLNAAIHTRVQDRITAGKKVLWADVNAALTVADLRDGIHPNTGGYAKVADVWFHALQPIAACLGGTP